MANIQQPRSNIKPRGYRKRRIAEAILKRHRVRMATAAPARPIRIVCISDTHNTRPSVPDGDVLIHAGDLSEDGSFDEVQAGLSWLSSQAHRYKIFVAGNHDVLLDEAFLAKHPERRYGDARTKADLDWGSVIYLEDTTVALRFPADFDADTNADREPTHREEQAPRSFVVFGSPWTPQYGISAFQYPADRAPDWWGDRLGRGADILVTHGPPHLHLDARGSPRAAGCVYLAAELARLRPRLAVFGHIHASHGREDVVLDGVRRAYEDVVVGGAGWGTVIWMAVRVLWGRLRGAVGWLWGEEEGVTTFVNAAVVGGPRNELRNPAIVVEI